MSIPNRPEYERLVYSLANHPQVHTSTLRLYSTSALTAIVQGELHLQNGLAVRVLEILDFRVGKIQNYSYAIYQEAEKIRWYDPQPHPENPALAATFPHHYHESPNIKHNRQAASGISFDSPNLLTLIADCIELNNS
ncbi:hypothetical protein MNBD_CHLOROFLEXI01-2693 [hydrothermal vent metagenome]|uniref:Uncharacterized protein n=1 Tax=hydrothermal vent metagenome TaxID=652676 RepID=A0A3B0V6G1_9ZZZZ